MDSKIKNIMGGAIVIAVLVAAYALISFAGSYSQSADPNSPRTFSVSADSKVTGVPDVAEFTFSVITEGGKDIASLQSDNTDKVNKAIDYVKSQGVDAKDIETQSYDIQPRQQYYNCNVRVDLPNVGSGSSVSGTPTPCPPPQIVGYTITQTVQIKVRDFKKIGDIMNGVVTAGANSVSQLSFVIDDPSKLQDQARAQAIDKAKARAQAVAQAAGFTMGKLVGIDENNGPTPVYGAYGMGGVAADSLKAAAPAPTIEPGSQDVTETVTLRYEIK